MASPLAMALSAPLPQQNMPTPTVGATDVAGIYHNAYNDQMQAYNAQMARNNALWGGLASIGGTVLGAAVGGPMGAAMGKSLGSSIGKAASPYATTADAGGGGIGSGGFNFLDAAA